MTIGEKIKEIRVLRGLTQKELGQLVNLSAVRIRQYEINNRTPKYETLKSIADALNVSIYTFTGIEIETLNDIKALLFELDKKIDIKFHGEKDKEGHFIPNTISLSFNDYFIMDFLKEWGDLWSLLSEYEQTSIKHDKNTQQFVKEDIESKKKLFELSSYVDPKSDFIISKKDNKSSLRIKLSPYSKLGVCPNNKQEQNVKTEGSEKQP